MKLISVAALMAFLMSGVGLAHAETRVGILSGVGITSLHQGEVLLTPGIHCGGHDYNPTTHFAIRGVVEFSWRDRLALRLDPCTARRDPTSRIRSVSASNPRLRSAPEEAE